MPSIPLRSLLDITQSSHRVEILPVRERDIFCASKSPADKFFWLLSDGAKERGKFGLLCLGADGADGYPEISK